ncbi:MAG: Uma2 family endonuclease [Defluviitaleaceae bacterium]|nr:Uma2 family endonuclease [Defluviitaleaceae bacterium]
MSLAYAYDDYNRDELLDGKIYSFAGASVAHNDVKLNIASLFKRLLKGRRCKVMPDGNSVFLSKNDRPIPDVTIVCNPAIIKADGIYGAPDLVVEVLSPSTERIDKNYKKLLYEKHGVKEYWIVNPTSPSIEVYILRNGVFELDNVYAVIPQWMLARMTDEQKSEIIIEFKTSLFDDLIVTLDEVFEGIAEMF